MIILKNLKGEIMTFEEWDNQLAEQAIELEEAAEAMNISMYEIKSWKEKGEVSSRRN